MRIIQNVWHSYAGWSGDIPHKIDDKISLVLAFGCREALSEESRFFEMKQAYPAAQVIMCSGAGEILGRKIIENGIAVTAIEFSKTKLKSHLASFSAQDGQHKAGLEIAHALNGEDLALVLVLADGQSVNGSQLVTGLNEEFKGLVPVIGGLAGDGANFETTLVGLNSIPSIGKIAAIGFYGSSLEIGFGSKGGWVPFGPERTVTKAENNVLFGLDGKSALSLYKSYLGDLATNLPAAGLRFPLSIKVPNSNNPTVRTILAVDEEAESMTFAGDIPVGSIVQLMKAGVDRLLDGVEDAVAQCIETGNPQPALAILVSCVGRRIVMDERAEEEVEIVAENLPDAAICGFYSYGEISTTGGIGTCALHNQTMTITTISEK